MLFNQHWKTSNIIIPTLWCRCPWNVIMFRANHVVFPWRPWTSRRMVSLLDSYPPLVKHSICGILHEYISINLAVYISYVIDASRGVPKVICEHQPALYGIKCVLRIFWQTWLHMYWRIKIFSTLCKYVPCNTLTHSTNEDLLNIKRKGDPEVSYVRYHWNPEPCVIKVILLACFTYIDFF